MNEHHYCMPCRGLYSDQNKNKNKNILKFKNKNNFISFFLSFFIWSHVMPKFTKIHLYPA